jgi:hypothetical protein
VYAQHIEYIQNFNIKTTITKKVNKKEDEQFYLFYLKDSAD